MLKAPVLTSPVVCCAISGERGHSVTRSILGTSAAEHLRSGCRTFCFHVLNPTVDRGGFLLQIRSLQGSKTTPRTKLCSLSKEQAVLAVAQPDDTDVLPVKSTSSSERWAALAPPSVVEVVVLNSRGCQEASGFVWSRIPSPGSGEKWSVAFSGDSSGVRQPCWYPLEDQQGDELSVLHVTLCLS